MDIQEIVKNYADRVGYSVEQMQSAVYRFIEAKKKVEHFNQTIFIEMEKQGSEAFYYVIDGGDEKNTAVDIMTFSMYVNKKGVKTAFFSMKGDTSMIKNLMGDFIDVEEGETTLVEVDTSALIKSAKEAA